MLGVVIVAVPLFAILGQSVLSTDGPGTSFTLAHFAAVFSNPSFLSATANTLLCGAAITVLSTALGAVLAWLVSRTDMPARRLLEMLNLVPFFLSPYVGALSWIYLAAPHGGLIQNTLRTLLGTEIELPSIFGRGGVIMVLTLFYTPYAYLFVIGPLRQMDGALEDAARVHGSSFIQTIRLIVVPLMMPALMSAGLIVFVTSAGLFDVPLALSAPSTIRMIPTEIYGLVQYPTDFGQASAVSVIILGVTVALTLVQRSYMERRRFDTVSGKAYRPRVMTLSRPAKAAALVLEVIYIGGAVVLPILALALVSFSTIWTGQFRWAAATLRNYKFILFGSDLAWNAITNSLYLAFAGATIAVVLSLLQAYFLQRGNPRLRRSIDILLSLSLGIPGIILGLGMLIVAVYTPLYSTLTLILVAYVIRFFPYSTRSLTAMLLSINPELEECARSCGANWFQTTRRILLPLMWPGIVSAWIMVFVILIRELGATILIYSQGNETISVALVLLGARNSGFVAALGIIQIVLLLGAMVILRLTRATLTPAGEGTVTA